MYLRTDKERKKVPWASVVVKRACEEFQLWLVRGTFSEGDDCQWDQHEVVEKSKRDKDEVKRRREDMMWREKILDKMLGLGSQAEKLISTRDPLGLDEKDSGTGRGVYSSRSLNCFPHEHFTHEYPSTIF